MGKLRSLRLFGSAISGGIVGPCLCYLVLANILDAGAADAPEQLRQLQTLRTVLLNQISGSILINKPVINNVRSRGGTLLHWPAPTTLELSCNEAGTRSHSANSLD